MRRTRSNDAARVSLESKVGGTAASSAEIFVRVVDEVYESVAREVGADEGNIPEVVSGERVTQPLERPA